MITHYHNEQLRKHCRICGNRLHKAKAKATAYTCANYQEQLLLACKIDISCDSDDTHPATFAIGATS